ASCRWRRASRRRSRSSRSGGRVAERGGSRIASFRATSVRFERSREARFGGKCASTALDTNGSGTALLMPAVAGVLVAGAAVGVVVVVLLLVAALVVLSGLIEIALLLVVGHG